MKVILIAAVGENGEMGRNNELLWHLPGDLPRFKEITMGSPLIMGRKTFDSIGRALPGRLNIVLTSNSDWHAEGVTVAKSVDTALAIAERDCAAKACEKIFVIGGGQIYKLFIAYAQTLEMTEVHDAPLADTFFPNFSSAEFTEIARTHVTDSTPTFDYVTYNKV